MNLIWIGLLVLAPIFVMGFTLAVCRSAGMADDAMDRMRASHYLGRVSLEPRGGQPPAREAAEEPAAGLIKSSGVLS
jgi:hypothetical protein